MKASKLKLDEDVTVEEVQHIMENVPVGKSAGPDRVPNAVFKYLAKHLAPFLTRVINEAMGGGKLPELMTPPCKAPKEGSAKKEVV